MHNCDDNAIKISAEFLLAVSLNTRLQQLPSSNMCSLEVGELIKIALDARVHVGGLFGRSEAFVFSAVKQGLSLVCIILPLLLHSLSGSR